MKVKELINFLNNCNPDAKVVIDAPYHNGLTNSLIYYIEIEPYQYNITKKNNKVVITIEQDQIPD